MEFNNKDLRGPRTVPPLRVNGGYLVSKDYGYWAVDTERKFRDAGLEGELKREQVAWNNWNYLLEDTPTNRAILDSIGSIHANEPEAV